ncbi:centrosomal protein of 290 kDa-like isoform X3 [Saccostrea echinata]|uniref:centrosomal protein of 290 kDa-like isoform X3 n=1 Tax=Saccostrea echinata TaxID=191078 RepID=UPI002A832C85|nr:centrosomal protein of 290 kDa-like isoform X3 [Saccostrea echinata]
MPPLDWDKLMAAKPTELSEEDVEEFYESLVSYNPEDESDTGKLQKLFDVSRVIMKAKNEACEEIMEEYEKEVKASKKKEEAMASKEKELQKKIAELEKYGGEGSAGGAGASRLVRDQMRDLERQNEELTTELRDLQSELTKEKRAAETYSEKISDLEKDLKEYREENDRLKSEVSDFKMHMEAQRDKLVSNKGGELDYREKLARKNHDLAEAMEELQNLTDANEEYQRQVEDMKAQIEEAVAMVERTTEDYSKLKQVLAQSDAVTDKLREENEVLKAQVIDLNEQVQSKTDADDAIMVAVNNKVEEWKEILQEKDEQMLELQEQVIQYREQLIAANMDADKASVAALSKVVKEKDKQIEDLTEQIKQFVDEMEKNTAIIEDLQAELKRSGLGSGDSQQKKIRNLQKEVDYYREKITELEKELKMAERDAREKDRELTYALEKQRKYENGEYGLAEAVQEIKDCKNQIKVRDRQIEELTSHINKTEMKINDIEEENEELRFKLGMDPRDPLDLTEFRKNKQIRKEEEKALNFILQKEVERLEDERVELKKKIRKLAQHTGQRAVALGLTAEDMMSVYEFQENLKEQKKAKEMETSTAEVIKREVVHQQMDAQHRGHDEDFVKNLREMDKLYQENSKHKAELEQLKDQNKQLEQGLKEVIENLKKYAPEEKVPGKGGVVPEEMRFPTLEKMLAAIEAKNLIGNYDTSMYLKAQVDNLQGRNEELRRELRETRHEGNKVRADLQRAKEKVEKLEADLKAAQESGGGTGGLFQSIPLPDAMAVSSSDVISNLNEHLITVLQEMSLKEDMMKKMENSLENYKRKFAVMRHQQGLLYSDYLKDKKEWEEEMDKIQEQLKKVNGEREEDSVQIQEYNRLIETLSKDDTEVRRRLSDMTRRITVLRVNEKALIRRHNTMEETEGQLRKEIHRYKNEMASMETAVQERMGYLQRFKDMATFKMAALQKAIEDSVPAADLELMNKRYHDLTEKYRDTLEKGNTLVSKAEALVGLENEVKRLTEDNEVLKKTLGLEKEKLHALEAAVEDLHKKGVTEGTEIKNLTDTDVISVSKKITTLEMKELNERQRAEHAVRMYEQQKSILHDLENRNKDLEEKFSEITKSNLELQKIERELRDELANSVTKEISEADRKKIMELEEAAVANRNEISKLKEISEVATSQVRTLEMVQLSREKENASLRQQLLDFQIQSDEKTIIGKLHRHIVQLQVSEGTAVRRLEESQKKVNKLEALVLRLEQKLDDKDQTLFHNRTESQGKVNHLKRNLQELRVQFAGAVPLSRQEKFSKQMMQLQQDKQKLELELKQAREHRDQEEDKLAELNLKNRSLQELIATLKDGRGAAKVVEWHSKMDAVRLEELKQRRLNSKLQGQIKYLEGVIRNNEATIADLEAESVRTTKECEEKQLRWEHREVELERTLQKMESQAEQIAGAASKFEQALGSLPDSKLPVANQLEQAITTIKSNVKVILDIQGENKVLKKRNEQLEKELHEAEKTVIARDKLISELRLRMPATAERDEIILRATSKVNAAMTQKPEEKDYQTEHSIKIAQSTISSLQARIQQKEETIAKYQELLKQARDDMQDMNKRHEQDLKNMQLKIHQNTDAAFNKFKDAARDLMAKQQLRQPATEKQAARIQELEDSLAEQDNAMAAMSEKIRQREEEIISLRAKLQQESRQFSMDKDRLGSEMKTEAQKKDSEVQDLKKIIEQQKREIEILNEEIEVVTEQNNRAPTTTMKNLVERLKNQLALKEKQHQALSKALTELRADMVQQAQETVKHQATESEQEINIQKIVDTHTRELNEKVDDLQLTVERQRKEIKKRKDTEATLQTDIDDLREEIGRKEKNLRRYKSDKERLEMEVEELEKKVERMGKMGTQRIGEETKQKEYEEMRRRVRMLEEELKRKQQQPEKPYEISKETPPIKELTKEKSEELVKWEEKKKWQKTVEKMRMAVREKEAEVERLEKSNRILKDQLDRAIREKDLTEKKLSNAQRGPVPAPRGPSDKPDHVVEELKMRNYQLQDKVTKLQRELTLAKDVAVREVEVRNKYLTEQLESMEQVVAQKVSVTSTQPGADRTGVSTKEFQVIFEKNQNLQRQMLALSEENIELKFENEQYRKDAPRLKERIADLQSYVEALKQENSQLGGNTARSFDSSGSSGIRRIGDSGKSVRELEKTIALLKKVVERVQLENEELKKAPHIAGNEELQKLRLENAGLKDQLEELRMKMGATLSERYTTTQKGTAKMMTDYEKMRKDLMKEIESNEKLRMEIRNLELQKEQLNSQLQDSKSMTGLERERPGGSGTMDSKGWKSAVVTRMYEGKLKDLEKEMEKKNKLLSDTKTLLKEAAVREQRLLTENQALKQKNTILEKYPHGAKTSDMGLTKDFQQARVTIERLENEKKEIQHELQIYKQQGGGTQLSGDVITKVTAYDRLMDENVEIKMQLRTVETEKDKYRLEMERLKKELSNFGPDFFEEIEDLKYNYKQALEKNILYEERLQQLGVR